MMRLASSGFWLKRRILRVMRIIGCTNKLFSAKYTSAAVMMEMMIERPSTLRP